MQRTRFAIIAWIVGIALGLLLFVFVLLPFVWSRSRVTAVKTPTLIRQIQSLSELVTVKFVLEKVVILEDVKWYGENRLLMLAHGVVKAGVDLSQLQEGDVEITGKKIKIKLPPSRVTDVYLDEKNTKIIERSTGMMRSFDKDLEQNGRRQALDDLKRVARNSGILEDADQRSRQQVEALFKVIGFEEVVFK